MRNLVLLFVSVFVLLLCGASAYAVEVNTVDMVDVTDISPYIGIEVVGTRQFSNTDKTTADFGLFSMTGVIKGKDDEYLALRDTTLVFSLAVRIAVSTESGRDSGDIAKALIFGVCAKKTRTCETLIVDEIKLKPGMIITITGVVVEPEAEPESEYKIFSFPPTVDEIFELIDETPKPSIEPGVYLWAKWEGGFLDDGEAWIHANSGLKLKWLATRDDAVFTLHWEQSGEESESEVTGSLGADSPRAIIGQTKYLLPKGTIADRLHEEGLWLVENGQMHILPHNQWGIPLLPTAYVPWLAVELTARPQLCEAYAVWTEGGRWEWWPIK